MRAEIKKIQEMMETADYVTDPAIAMSVHLAMTLKKPLLIEGHAGVGKTEIAKVMARMLGTSLIRLQCYEGLDAAQALYEWNYPKQLLHIKLEESSTHSTSEKEAAIFSPPFLIRRPLLQAISQPGAPPVLLIDEIDRADEEFEAFLLEVLSDFQVTIPEIGTIKATQPPYVILTSNRVRELSDALRRRCLYLWIDFPGYEKEVRIVTRKVPGVNERLAREISRFMETVRTIRLAKVPGVAETLDWAQALSSLHADHLDEDLVAETLGCVVKDADDVKRLKRELASGGIGRFVTAKSWDHAGSPGPHACHAEVRGRAACLGTAGDHARGDGRGPSPRGDRPHEPRRGLSRAPRRAGEPRGGAAHLRPLLRELLAFPGRGRPGSRRARPERAAQLGGRRARRRVPAGRRGEAGPDRARRLGRRRGHRRRARRGAWALGPRSAHGAGLLDLPRRAARRSGPAHRADRQAIGPSDQPASEAHAEGRRDRPPPQHAGQSHEGRDHRAPAPGAAAAQGSPRAPLRRLRLHGPLQPLPPPVPLRPPERLRARGDLHFRHAPDPCNRAAPRTIV